MRKLTAKQELFVAEYLIDLNATQAAIRSGYSKKNASKIGPELLGKTRVRQAIDAAQAKRIRRIDISADWVVRKLIRNRSRSDKAERFAAVNKALELIGKHLGMFGERIELTGLNRGPIAVADMTDAELARIASEAADASTSGEGTAAPPAGAP